MIAGMLSSWYTQVLQWNCRWKLKSVSHTKLPANTVSVVITNSTFRSSAAFQSPPTLSIVDQLPNTLHHQSNLRPACPLGPYRAQKRPAAAHRYSFHRLITPNPRFDPRPTAPKTSAETRIFVPPFHPSSLKTEKISHRRKI